MRRSVALALSVMAVALVRPVSSAGNVSRLGDLPRLVLWAWERPEDLRALPADVGVAFLAQTVVARGDRLTNDPRRQPLRVSPATPLIAVTRVEIRPGTVSDDAASEFISLAVARTAALPRVRAVQLDFDATASQRDLYRQLILRTRATLPEGTGLSITALASWCMADEWLEGLPIDEAVPMLFRMGPEWPEARRVAAARRLDAPECRSALGLSLDEPLDVEPRGRRVYLFNPRSWTTTSVTAVREAFR